MFSRRLWEGIRFFLSRSAFSRLVSEHQFLEMMEYERNRADRTRGKFSVVIIEPEKRGMKTFARLGQRIGSRLRATDFIGELNAERYAILLPDTSADGAESFIDRMEPILTGGISLKSHTYPSDGPVGGADVDDVEFELLQNEGRIRACAQSEER
jgi:hypothetical protein